ncbi:hypothetical protein MY04_3993 [Flammeovirga sp. MY04]|uniref:hypothetical protein n=1 Tax=Flammeovirga sp. MY04 TaxID=1191459 RepID=UPI0008061A2F|nr:hypothetical protein [Flammeovirga sp. MY04]ANQ51337.1 hypothetical protein MY04_3993 [Flammeovirga sp. MY04]
MQTLIKKLSLLIVTNFLLFGCASSYHPIAPQSLSYNSTYKLDDFKLRYEYNVLRNNKYKKKESKRGIHLVAVEFTNNSDHDVVFGKDVLLVSTSGAYLDPISTQDAFVGLKQSVESYLLYLLLSFTTFDRTTTDSNGRTESSSFPIGLIIGPGIAGGNMITAGNANAKFKSELEMYDIMNKTIHAGETKHGIVALRTNSYPSLTLKLAGDQ